MGLNKSRYRSQMRQSYQGNGQKGENMVGAWGTGKNEQSWQNQRKSMNAMPDIVSAKNGLI